MKQRFLRGHRHTLYVLGCTEHTVTDPLTEGPLITRAGIYHPRTLKFTLEMKEKIILSYLTYFFGNLLLFGSVQNNIVMFSCILYINISVLCKLQFGLLFVPISYII